MFELTINNQVYGFNFGMGFMRKINQALKQPVDGLKNVDQNVGLRYKIACLMDGDVEALVEILDAANANQDPRVTRKLLDDYIDNPETDLDELFDSVIDFLRKTNATKKTVAQLDEAAAKQKEKEAAAAAK